MATDSSSFSTSAISAEILMFLVTYFMVSYTVLLLIQELRLIIWTGHLSHGLSSIFKLFLPLLSYMDLQAQQQQDSRRSQIVLVWMVTAELINMNINLVDAWQIWDSIEQCIRFVWVGYLVFGSSSAGPSQALRISLLVVCSVAFMYEIFRWVTINLAERSVRLGKNPQLIDLYMKQILEQDVFEVPAMMGPMATCKYIVFGEETIAFRNGSHVIEGINSNLNLITVGQLYQPKPKDEAFTSRYPCWREICTSFALAKILRRRFAQLPLAEAGNEQALKFVMGLIGSNYDNANPVIKEISDEITFVFYIIQNELSFLSDFLSIKVSTCYLYLRLYLMFTSVISLLSIEIFFCAPQSLKVRQHYTFKSMSAYMAFIDFYMIFLLLIPCIFLQLKWLVRYRYSHWNDLATFRSYLKHPTKWDSISRKISKLTDKWQFKLRKSFIKYTLLLIMDSRVRLHSIVLNIKYSTRFARNRYISHVLGAVHRVDVQKALLRSLKMSEGKLTNGESSLSRHRVTEQLSWACQPSLGSNTETILVWHIATTLFYEQNPPAQPLDSDPRVAISLSSYCEYLVLWRPQLLPDVVYLTKSLYKEVKEELSRANLPGYKKSASELCSNIRDKTWGDDSAIGKGVRLVKDLEEIARIRILNHNQVWQILADFWVEMMLYVAPSDNVEGHRNVLDEGQLITQLWALLTHAGIIARPPIPRRQDQAGSSSAV